MESYKKTAIILCEIYFDIAAELIGEDEVRKRRDIKLEKIFKKIRRLNHDSKRNSRRLFKRK